ncbi:MAG TPA: hypothetical protein VFE40_11925 [Jatrophihabitantaceae bacterium]|jgi:hypothetical protein|nr:hypothetical protein [Jatrophihabitantaceae bacterium]
MSEQFNQRSDEGRFGDETARVLSAVQDWATRTFPESAEQHANGTCQWCPICQFVAVLRGERPDVTDRVVEAGTALLSAFRAFMDATVPHPDSPAAHGDSAPHGDPAARRDSAPPPRVQRIDLGKPDASRPRPKPYPDAGA